MRRRSAWAVLAALTIACGQAPDSRASVTPATPATPPENPPRRAQVQEGFASFYASTLHGRRTASGERYDANALVAAHPSYPFGTIVRVTNLSNGRTVDVRIVDRGPNGASRRRTIIDLSRRAAADLRVTGRGRVRVRVEVLRWANAR